MKRIAHRGASAYAADNSIVAIMIALHMGSDIIEMDIRPRNGELILAHDLDDVGPRLHDVLDMINYRAGVYLDIKLPTDINLLLNTANKYPWAMFACTDSQVVKEIKQRCSSVVIGLIEDEKLLQPCEIDKGISFIALEYKHVTAERIVTFRQKCPWLEIYVWTVNNNLDIIRSVIYGVDGIISDYPDRVPSYFSEKKIVLE